jgi:hypothetical protein
MGRLERDFGLNSLDFCMHCGVRTPFATLPRTGAERFLDDGSDRSGTSTAFGTASKTSVDLSGRAPQVIRCGYGGANIVIGQHVTGTNNHKQNPLWHADPTRILLEHAAKRKGKTGCLKLFQTSGGPDPATLAACFADTM